MRTIGRNGEGGLLISCARGTRGIGRPSLGLMARLGVPVGGRVRKLRAVGDQAGHPSVKGITSELGRSYFYGECAGLTAAIRADYWSQSRGGQTSELGES